MEAERIGGWGRSIAGVRRMIKKLSLSAQTQARAVELRSYIDIVEKARQLQPARLHDLEDGELAQILDTMVRGKVTSPPPPNVQAALVAREIKQLAQKAEGRLDSDQAWAEFVNVVLPCKRGSGAEEEAAAPKFDPKQPKLCDMKGGLRQRR